MDNTALQIDKGQFNRLFPFYILINPDLMINACGSTLEKMFGQCTGELFGDHFYLSRPEIEIADFNSFKINCDQLLIIKSKHYLNQILRGQFEYLENEDKILFVGSPWFDSIEQLRTAGLSFNDFAFHDPLIDLLHVLKNQELVNDDLKLLLNTVNKQKNELKNATAEIKDVALFPMQSPDPVFRVRTDGNIIMENPAGQELSSFLFRGTLYTHEGFWKFIAAKGDYITDRWTFEVVADNKTFSFICRYLPDQNYFNVYGRDVTKQKKSEEDLKRLSLVASANDNGVLFNNSKGEILWANDGFCKMTGFSLQEVVGKKTLDFCKGPLNDESTFDRIAGSVGKAESFNEELVHYRKDGSWFWGRAKGQSYKTGETNEIEYFAIVEDITEEKERENRLTILSKIAESNINGVIITDKEGYISWVNKSFTKISGYTLHEAINKKPGHLLQGPETDPKTVAYLRDQIINAKPFNTEILNYSKAGLPHWLRIQGQPILNKKGELTGFFALEEDITKEKEIQQRIKESEARFRLVLEKIGDNVWELDLKNGKALFTKPYHSFGSHSNDIIVNGEDLWWNNVYKDDLRSVKEQFAKYISGEIDSQNIEYRIVQEDGSIKWVLDRGVVIEKDKNGKPMRLLGTHSDISKIKQTETELEQRVKQFKSLSENIPGIIYEYEFRPNGTEGLRYVSPAVERIFGIKPEDFYNYSNYLLPEDKERIKKKNEHSRNTLEPFYDESLLLIPGGEQRWHAVHSSFSYITLDGAIVFTGFMMDITERKNIENNLRKNEEKYRGIIANMNLGLLEINGDSKIIFANQCFSDMSGFSIDELKGKNVNDLPLKGESSHIVQQRLGSRKTGLIDAYEAQAVNKQGEVKWWLVSGAPRFNDKNEAVGSIAICLDISVQKKLEKELIDSKIRAENLARTKETFLANMSHEIRTPMNAIIGMGNQLAKTKLNEQQNFFLEIINSAAENLLVIINDILDLSKIEAGKLSFENIGFELQTVAKRVIQVLAHRAEEKGLNLRNSRFDSNISSVLIGDPYRLNQVLLNLIGNAIKFTESGSVDLEFKLLKDNDDSQLIQVDVMDTGIGMDESFVKHVFDKFSQEYESVSRKYGGTGLGMSISKELVELMGGNIYAESKKGIGSTITFVVEFKKGAVNDLPDRQVIKFSSDFLNDKKILVTDDNELNRLVASIILQNYGADVVEASSGQQAIDIINNQNVDIVLMDIQMPGMNGIQATRIIRENNKTIPIIALTAEAIHGEREKSIAAGMNDYITKPFKEDLFLKIIDNLLHGNSNLQKSEEPEMKMETEKLYDLSSLVEISRGNQSFVKKMVDMFCEQTPKLVDEMLSAFKTNDLEHMGSIAHKMKPSIDNLNISSLKQVIRDIEAAGHEKIEQNTLSAYLKATDSVIKKVVTMMKEEFPTE